MLRCTGALYRRDMLRCTGALYRRDMLRCTGETCCAVRAAHLSHQAARRGARRQQQLELVRDIIK
jgi:hypothetical protein